MSGVSPHFARRSGPPIPLMRDRSEPGSGIRSGPSRLCRSGTKQLPGRAGPARGRLRPRTEFVGVIPPPARRGAPRQNAMFRSARRGWAPESASSVPRLDPLERGRGTGLARGSSLWRPDRALLSAASRFGGPAAESRAARPTQASSQTETCWVLSWVGPDRSESAQRCRSVMPAIRAVRSISAGHA